MTRLPVTLTRRIDRLAAKAHRFHRYAHHPLCNAYSSELIALGRRQRICRGCAFAALGALGGTALGLTLTPSPWLTLASVVLGGGAALLSLRTRLPKSLGRLLPALCAAFATTAALCAGGTTAWLALACVAAVLALTALYRQRGPNRSPCTTCPERHSSSPCSGFHPIVRRERAFQRLAQRWIDAERVPASF